MAPIGSEKETALSGARPLRADDLEELCSLDEQSLRADIARDVSTNKTRVALIPDLETIRWHHAREEFAGREMLGREPDIKGAHSDCQNISRVWCIWTRTFGSTEAGNTLHILRFFVEGEENSVRDESKTGGELSDLTSTDQAKLHGAAAVLHAAQLEAAKWDMKDVQIWNRKALFWFISSCSGLLSESQDKLQGHIAQIGILPLSTPHNCLVTQFFTYKWQC